MTSTYEIIIDRNRVRNEIRDIVILRALDDDSSLSHRGWPTDIELRVRMELSEVRRRGVSEDRAVIDEAREQLARALAGVWKYRCVTPRVPDFLPD